MGIWSRIKAFTATAWTQASLRMIPGVGNGARYRACTEQAQLQQFQGWVYAAAMMNAQGVASTPLRLYRKRRKGGMSPQGRAWQSAVVARPVSRKTIARFRGEGALRPSSHVLRKAAEWGDQYEEVVDTTPVMDVLSKVNPYLNGYQLSLLRILYQELTGNAYIHVVTDPAMGVPSELWPMPSQWTTILSEEGKLVSGYRYGRMYGQEATFQPEEVIHFKYPNPHGLLYGLGKVEAAWGAVSVSSSKREMDVALFDNMARPDYLMIVKSGATKEALDRFENNVSAKLRGAHQAGKFLTITGDVDLKPLNFAPKEMGNPEAVVEEIAAVFGVPVSKLKTNDPNRANADSANTGWLRDTVHPLCVQDEEKLNESYLPLFNLVDDAFLAYDNPVPSDSKAEMLRRISYVQNGIMTVNEARAEEGMPPIAGGDVTMPTTPPGSRPEHPEGPRDNEGGNPEETGDPMDPGA